MMDKKTIWVVLGCLLAMFAWQWFVNWLFPPVPKRARSPVISEVTNRVETADGAQEVSQPSLSPPVLEPVATAAVERRPEQTVALENNHVRITFSSWGGGIRSVELLQHAARDGRVRLHAGDIPALAIRGLEEADFDVQVDGQTVTFRRAGIEKRFVLGDDYRLDCAVTVTHTNTATLLVGTAMPLEPHEPPDLLTIGWLVDTKYHYEGAKRLQEGPRHHQGPLSWGAANNQFFTLLLTPRTNAVAIHCESATVTVPAGWTGKPPPAVRAWLEVPLDGRGQVEFTYYAGPKELRRLLALGGGQEEVMHLGLFGPISLLLLRAMNGFHRLIPNYGVAIVLVTVCIKILFWPIQAKSIKAMKEMQKFQPVMAKLREKYKDDPQKLNAEMMRLYKEHKINPFAGCLPMLVQIPFFIAFYAMLRSAVELRGASFLWINDLSQPDTILRVAGLPINPLPLLMGASMIWQMKLTPQTGDTQQQKIMMFMPLIFLFICYNMASGLVLYWTVQQLLSIAQQWWSMRQPDTAPAPAAVSANK
ncbi:MAG: membrane protein insertase YidC [Verrucomicrobiae bacterium]|nr:membrane protein insertase YidC [Verrucomicrobiae bacterium]